MVDWINLGCKVSPRSQSHREFAFKIHCLFPDRLCRFELRVEEVEGSGTGSLPNGTPQPAPEYPSHPFSPDLCILLAKLPTGFVDLIIERRVCREIVQRLIDIAPLSDLKPGETVGSESYCAFEESKRWISMVKWSLTEMEHYLCVGVLAYLDGFKGNNLRPMTHTAVEGPVAQLDRCVLWQSDVECMMWIAVMISSLHDSEEMPLRNRWLLFDQIWDWDQRFRNWPTLAEILKKYFWAEHYATTWQESWALGEQRNSTRWNAKIMASERPP